MQNLSTSRVLADPRTESGVCYTPPSAHEAQLPFTAHLHPEPFIRQPWCGPGLRVVPFPLQREKGEKGQHQEVKSLGSPVQSPGPTLEIEKVLTHPSVHSEAPPAPLSQFSSRLSQAELRRGEIGLSWPASQRLVCLFTVASIGLRLSCQKRLHGRHGTGARGHVGTGLVLSCYKSQDHFYHCWSVELAWQNHSAINKYSQAYAVLDTLGGLALPS